MIKVRYRKETGDTFQEEIFEDNEYDDAQRRFGEAIHAWAQVEIVLFDQIRHVGRPMDLVILDHQGIY